MKTKFISFIHTLILALLLPFFSNAQCGNQSYKMDNTTHMTHNVTINYVDCGSNPQHYYDVAYAMTTNTYTIPNCNYVTDVWVYDTGTCSIDSHTDDGTNYNTTDYSGDGNTSCTTTNTVDYQDPVTTLIH